MPSLVLAFALAALFSHPIYAAKPSQFDGYWTINLTETDKVAPKIEEGSGIQGNLGRLKPTIDIGLGLPLPRKFVSGPASPLRANDPEVLLCTTMHMVSSGKKVNVRYDNLEKETLVKGSYRGRSTSISSKSINQKYKTTERKVTKTWTIRPDGRLLVTVKVNPKKDKARTFLRVFDRTEAPTTSTPGETPDSEKANSETSAS